jgi:deoxyribose-phosphate aldolase
MYKEVKAMKAICGPDVHMKAILAVGELASMNNVYKASLVCMMAGADFIKTSTGKEAVNAILPVGVVMCRYTTTSINLSWLKKILINLFQGHKRLLRENRFRGWI